MSSKGRFRDGRTKSPGQISKSSMLDYDLFNKVGSHSMMHRYRSGNGYYVSESTTGAYDRVVYRWITDSYANNFTTRRFNNVCS